MLNRKNNPQIVGFYSSVLVSTTLALFALFLLLSLLGIHTLYASFMAIMTMGIGFVAMQASIYLISESDKKIYSLLGLVFAIMFSVFISIAYYLQLAVVKNNSLNLSYDALRLITYSPGSLSFALDMLGFTFLCLSVFALIPIYLSAKDRLLRTFLWINGLLALPTFMFPIFFVNKNITPSDQVGSWIIFVWCLVFLPISLLLARMFKNQI